MYMMLEIERETTFSVSSRKTKMVTVAYIGVQLIIIIKSTNKW